MARHHEESWLGGGGGGGEGGAGRKMFKQTVRQDDGKRQGMDTRVPLADVYSGSLCINPLHTAILYMKACKPIRYSAGSYASPPGLPFLSCYSELLSCQPVNILSR